MIGLVYQFPMVRGIRTEVKPQFQFLGVHHHFLGVIRTKVKSQFQFMGVHHHFLGVHHHFGPKLYHSNPIHPHPGYQVQRVPFFRDVNIII